MDIERKQGLGDLCHCLEIRIDSHPPWRSARWAALGTQISFPAKFVSRRCAAQDNTTAGYELSNKLRITHFIQCVINVLNKEGAVLDN